MKIHFILNLPFSTERRIVLANHELDEDDNCKLYKYVKISLRFNVLQSILVIN